MNDSNRKEEGSTESESGPDERESVRISRRNLLKLAAAGAAALGIVSGKAGEGGTGVDDYELPDELNLEGISIPEDGVFELKTEKSKDLVLSYNPSTETFNAQGQKVLNMSIAQFGDSLRLPYEKTRMETLENVKVNPRETRVLANLSGESIVSSIWMATYGKARMGRDALLRIYTDRSTEPDLEVDIGTLWATHLSVKGKPLLNSTRHMSVGSNWANRRQAHVVMSFPMPCSDGIRIEVQNTNPHHPGYIYSQVTHRDGVTAPFRLKGQVVPYFARKEVLSDWTTFPILDLSDKAGWLIWTSSCVNAKLNDSFMEADLEVYVDGESKPSLRTSGWEDWYRSGFYYYSSVYSTPYMMCNARNSNANYTSVGLDLMEMDGGLRFNSSIKTQLDLSEVYTGFDISGAQLYYEECQ